MSTGFSVSFILSYRTLLSPVAKPFIKGKIAILLKNGIAKEFLSSKLKPNDIYLSALSDAFIALKYKSGLLRQSSVSSNIRYASAISGVHSSDASTICRSIDGLIKHVASASLIVPLLFVSS